MDPHDHRALGNRLDLFHQQEEGPGQVFWHPRGYALYRVVEDYIRRRMAHAGFREIRTPQLLSRSLWEKSGHWEKFAGGMFTLADGAQDFALKPMSCPGHIQVFAQRLRSFRELPLRFCEFGACLRNEPSGGLYGLMRTRAFVQDDAHIFCSEDQVVTEVARFCGLLHAVYADFGFNDVAVGFSTRPAIRAGSDAVWDRAEAQLEAAAKAAGLDYMLQPGEGAFYGPKLEFVLKDSHGRAWQCGTVQLDMVLPERLDAWYADAHDQRLRPVMIHHAVLGSLERFVGMLLEHYRGQLPLWLAPDQIVVASLDAAQAGYAEDVAAQLRADDFRVAVDARAERLSRKVADAHAAGIPVLLAVGPREAIAGTVSLRRGDAPLQTLSVAAAVDALRDEAFR